MGGLRSVPTASLLVLAAWMATINPLRADTGSVLFFFDKAAVVAGFGVGHGKLTFQGKRYSFKVSGVSFGATLAVTSSRWEGKALNMRAPGDLAGDHSAVGAGTAIVGGMGVARLQNANGVILDLRGIKMGAGLSLNWAHVTITME